MTTRSLDDLRADPGNAHTIGADAAAGLAASTRQFGDIAGITWNAELGLLVAGHARVADLRAVGATDWTVEQPVGRKRTPPDGKGQEGRGHVVRPDTGARFTVRIVRWGERTHRLAQLAANNPHIQGTYTDAALEQLRGLAGVPSFGDLGLDRLLAGLSAGAGADPDAKRRAATTLAERFGVPPFSVLDARQGYWQARKRAWYDLLDLAPEQGREHLKPTANASEGHPGTEYMSGRGGRSGGSAFDPVLCELAYRWFCPTGGHVLNPFAGEATPGLIAGHLGYPYLGVDVRAEQVAANAAQAKRHKLRAPPAWIAGDSAKLDVVLSDQRRYDLVWCSPPYYDLEVYSDGEGDGSAMPDYAAFVRWLSQILLRAAARLRPGRFLGVKLGDVRDDAGVYRGLVADTIAALRAGGLHLYNSAVLVTPLGSLPVRAARAFTSGRKLGRTHQDVLWFYNAPPATIGKGFPRRIEHGDVPTQDDGT